MLICEIENCNEKGYVRDEMDNILCGDHYEQDMQETGKYTDEYDPIYEEDHGG